MLVSSYEIQGNMNIGADPQLLSGGLLDPV